MSFFTEVSLFQGCPYRQLPQELYDNITCARPDWRDIPVLQVGTIPVEDVGSTSAGQVVTATQPTTSHAREIHPVHQTTEVYMYVYLYMYIHVQTIELVTYIGLLGVLMCGGRTTFTVRI